MCKFTHIILTRMQRKHSERRLFGSWGGGCKEKTVHDLVVLSPFLWAVKQTAWQSCLPRQVNKMKQSPGATAGKHYHFEGSQKNGHIPGQNSPKEAINYPLSLATAAEKVNLMIWKTGVVLK